MIPLVRENRLRSWRHRCWSIPKRPRECRSGWFAIRLLSRPLAVSTSAIAIAGPRRWTILRAFLNDLNVPLSCGSKWIVLKKIWENPKKKNAVNGASRCRAGRFIELELLLKGFSIEWGTSMSCLRGSSGCDRTSPTQAHAKRNAEYSRVSTRFLSWRSEGFEAANIDKYWAMFSGKHGNRPGLNCTATVRIDSGLLNGCNIYVLVCMVFTIWLSLGHGVSIIQCFENNSAIFCIIRMNNGALKTMFQHIQIIQHHLLHIVKKE